MSFQLLNQIQTKIRFYAHLDQIRLTECFTHALSAKTLSKTTLYGGLSLDNNYVEMVCDANPRVSMCKTLLVE